jgi:hypothetical protein
MDPNKKQTIASDELTGAITLSGIGVSEDEHCAMEQTFKREFARARKAEIAGEGQHYPFYVVAASGVRARALDAYPALRESSEPILIVYDVFSRRVVSGFLRGIY